MLEPGPVQFSVAVVECGISQILGLIGAEEGTEVIKLAVQCRVLVFEGLCAICTP